MLIDFISAPLSFRMTDGLPCRLAAWPQGVPLSKNLKIAVTPLMLTPFVPFRFWLKGSLIGVMRRRARRPVGRAAGPPPAGLGPMAARPASTS